MPDNTVVRKNAYLTNTRAKEIVAERVGKAVAEHGKDQLAKAADLKSVRAVEKWMAQVSLPTADVLTNLLDIEPQILGALVSEKGWSLTPKKSEAANDMELAAGLGHGLSELIDRLRDGHRCHVDTAVLAALFRELIPQMQAIVDEDDKRRAA